MLHLIAIPLRSIVTGELSRSPMVLKTWDGVAALPALLVPANVGGTQPKSPTLAISFPWPAFEVLLAGRFPFASIRVVAQTIFLQAACEPILSRVVSFEHSRTFYSS